VNYERRLAIEKYYTMECEYNLMKYRKIDLFRKEGHEEARKDG
jgi:hypothetical protein